MSAQILIYILIATTPIWGYIILINNKLNPSFCGWIITIVYILVIYFFVKASPILLMLLYIISTFWSLKMVVANNQLGKQKQLNFKQWLVFSYGWFGMNPAPFKTFPNKPIFDYFSHVKKGVSRIFVGLILINSAHWFFPKILHNHIFDYLENSFYLIGLSLILHFGVLNISTGLLKYKGVNVSVLFNNPLHSKTLQEFWSKRWNLAFVELTTIAVLRPFKKRFGYKIAFWGSYIFSGLLHEMAISLPIITGFGKPFLYFILQAIFILVFEKKIITPNSTRAKRLGWLLCCLFLPIFILFHHQFILQIVLPMVQFLSLN